MDNTSEILKKRIEKIRTLKDQGIRLFPNDFEVIHSVNDIKAAIEKDPSRITENGPSFQAGRTHDGHQRFGKSTFIRFRDRTGQLQAYVRKDKLGEEGYTFFKQLDIGDFVGLSGPMFQTKTGEWTLIVEQLTLLCKATRPLPEKFHGLKDPEKRTGSVDIDLIMNGDSRDIFIRRSRIIQAVRNFLIGRDFLEVETPMMQPIPGGAEATPFVTHHNALDMDLFLRIAPELYLKRLVVGGFERVFEINRSFRNEGVSTKHKPNSP